MLISHSPASGKSLYARLSRIMEADPQRSPGLSESTASGDATTISLAAVLAAKASAENEAGFAPDTPLSLDALTASATGGEPPSVQPLAMRKPAPLAPQQAMTSATPAGQAESNRRSTAPLADVQVTAGPQPSAVDASAIDASAVDASAVDASAVDDSTIADSAIDASAADHSTSTAAPIDGLSARELEVAAQVDASAVAIAHAKGTRSSDGAIEDDGREGAQDVLPMTTNPIASAEALIDDANSTRSIEAIADHYWRAMAANSR